MNIKISNQELKAHGCVNCIWKIHEQCPHDHDDPEGICKEFTDFILSFATEDDSVNALWEKFALYIARLQSLNDYKEFLELKTGIGKKKESMDYKEKMQADIQLNTLRLWWERLNDTVLRGYGKISDREDRKKESGKLPGIMNAKTINFNIEDKSKKQIGVKDEKEKNS